MDRKVVFGKCGFDTSSSSLVPSTAASASAASSSSTIRRPTGFAKFARFSLSDSGSRFGAFAPLPHTFTPSVWADTGSASTSMAHRGGLLTTISAPTYDPNLPSRFTSLPPEVRNCIYRYLFEGVVVYDTHMRYNPALAKRAKILAILQTCRLCYNEAQEPFYRMVKFITNRFIMPELTKNVFPLDGCRLLRSLELSVDRMGYLPAITHLQSGFPSLQDLVIHLEPNFSDRVPLGFVEDVSYAMRKSGYDYPHDIGRSPSVHGMMLRWLYMMDTFRDLVSDLWNLCQHHHKAGRTRLNVSLEFGVEFGLCVQIFGHTSLYRLAKDRHSLWWNQSLAADDDASEHTENNAGEDTGDNDEDAEEDDYEDIPADLEDAGVDLANDDDRALSMEDRTYKHARRPGVNGCPCKSCLPSMVDDPRWKVQCVFDVRTWTWTFNVADHWWKCGELDGETDLSNGWYYEPRAHVKDIDEDLLTTPGCGFFRVMSETSACFRWNS